MYGSLDGFLFPDIEKSIAVAYEFGWLGMPKVNLIVVVLHFSAFPFDVIKGTLWGEYTLDYVMLVFILFFIFMTRNPSKVGPLRVSIHVR